MNKETSMTKKIRLYYVTRPNTEPHYHISDVDMSKENFWTLVEEKEVTFDLPVAVEDLYPMIIQGLEETRDKMRATAAAAITEVDGQIASYLALDNDSVS